jgi:hypothetical protein
MNKHSKKFIYVFGAVFVTILMFSSSTAIPIDLGENVKQKELGESTLEINEEKNENTFLVTSINTGKTLGTFWGKVPLLRFWFLLYHGPWQITICSGGSINIGGTNYKGPLTVKMPFFIGMASCNGNDIIHFIHGIGFGVSIS